MRAIESGQRKKLNARFLEIRLASNASLLRTKLRLEPGGPLNLRFDVRLEVLSSITKMPSMWPWMGFDNEPKAIVGNTVDAISQVLIPSRRRRTSSLRCLNDKFEAYEKMRG